MGWLFDGHAVKEAAMANVRELARGRGAAVGCVGGGAESGCCQSPQSYGALQWRRRRRRREEGRAAGWRRDWRLGVGGLEAAVRDGLRCQGWTCIERSRVHERVMRDRARNPSTLMALDLPPGRLRVSPPLHGNSHCTEILTPPARKMGWTSIA
jgi:hypothetical protein